MADSWELLDFFNEIDKKKGSEVLAFENLDDLLAGREKASRQAIDAAIQLGKRSEAENRSAWEQLDEAIRPSGSRVVVSAVSRDKGSQGASEYHALLVPNGQPMDFVSHPEYGKRLGKMHLSLLKNKLASLYGATVVNRGLLHSINGHIAYTQTNTEIAREVAKAFKQVDSNLSAWMRELNQHEVGSPEWNRAMRRVQSIVGYRDRQAWSGAAARSFQTPGENLFEELQASGSKRATAIRRGMTSVAPMMQDIVEEHAKYFAGLWRGKYGQNSRMDKDRVAQDLWRILSLYTQQLAPEKIDKQVSAMQNKSYIGTSYLITEKTKQLLANYGRQLQALGAEIGTSPETAVDKMLISLVRNIDLSAFGGLDDPSNRKRYQTAQGLARTSRANEWIKANQKYFFDKKIFTKFERAMGLDQELGETKQYGYFFAGEDEIRAAIKRLKKRDPGTYGSLTLNAGAHSGGVYVADDVLTSLNSYMARSKSFTRKEYDDARARVLKTERGKQATSDELEYYIQLGLLRMPFKKYYKPQDTLGAKKFSANWVREPEGRELYTINYNELRDMRGGVKVVGTEAYDIKGSATALQREIMQEVIRGRSDLTPGQRAALERASIMYSPDGLTNRNFASIFGTAVSGIFAQLEQHEIETLLSEAGLSGWLKWDDQKGGWTVNKAKFAHNKSDRARKTELTNFVEGLKAGLEAIGHSDLGDALLIDQKGSIGIDYKKFFGVTGIQQWSGYEYGDPGAAINADYRLRGAVDRALISARMGSGQKMDAISRMLLGERVATQVPGQEHWRLKLDPQTRRVVHGGVLSGTAADREKYARWQYGLEQIMAVNKDTVENGQNWTLERAATNLNDVVAGYGSFDEILTQYGITDEAKRQELKDAYVKTGRYLDLSQFVVPGGPDYDKNGQLTKEAWEQSFGLIQALQRGGRRLAVLPFGGGTFGGESRYRGKDMAIMSNAMFLPFMADFMAEGDENKFVVPAAFRGFGRVITAMHDAWLWRNDEQQRDRWRGYASDAMVNFMGDMQATYQSKEGSAFREANRTPVWHSMMGEATAPTVKDDDRWGELGDVVTRVSLHDAPALLRMQGENDPADYYTALATQYHLLYKDLEDDNITWDRLEKIFDSGNGNAYEINERLIQAIIDATTYGSVAFNERKKLAQTKAGANWQDIFRGLSGATLRFPLSNGLDFRATDIFFDDTLARNEIRGALGAAFGVNTDFDGDKLAAWLTLLSGGSIKGQNLTELEEQYAALSKSERQRSKIQAWFYKQTLQKDYGGMGAIDDKTKKHTGKSYIALSDLINKEAEEAGAILSRLNKSRTGMFSNNYQNITEALATLSGHSDSAGGDVGLSKRHFLQDIITRAVFEGFTQDAISAKKVSQRIRKAYGKDWTDSEKFYTDVDALMARFKSAATYENEDTIKAALKTGVDMGIFGGDGEDFFNSRMMGLLMAEMSTMSSDPQERAQMIKEALGLHSLAEAKALQMKISSRGKILGRGTGTLGIDTVAHVLFKQNERLEEAGLGGFSAVQWDAGARPGGINVALNAVGQLGKVSTAYDALKNAASDATKALSGEAAAEQRKIGIAGQETSAIQKGTEAYRDRATALENLEDVLNNVDVTSVSVSSRLDRLLGNHYNDDKDVQAFQKNLIATYMGNPLAYAGHQGVTTMPGYTQARFKSLRAGLLAQTQGRMADATDQLLAVLHNPKHKTALAFADLNPDELSLMEMPSVIAKLLGATGRGKTGKARAEAQHKLGEELAAQFYSSAGIGSMLGLGTREDYERFAKDWHGKPFKEWTKEAQKQFLEDVVLNKYLYPALYGTEGAKLQIENQQGMGELMNAFIKHISGGKAATREGGLVYVDENGRVTHGRSDVQWMDDNKIINILDKKTTGDFSSWETRGVPIRYALQDVLYANAALQASEMLQSPTYSPATYEQWQDLPVVKALRERFGVEVTEQEFKDFKAAKKTGVITHLAVETPNNEIADFKAAWSYGDLDMLRKAAAYIAAGTPEEEWEPGVLSQIRKRFGHGDAGFVDARVGNSAVARWRLEELAKQNSLGGSGGLLGQLGGKLGRLLAARAPMLIFQQIVKGVKTLITDATALDKTLTNLSITTGDTRDNTRTLINEYAKLGKSLGATTQEVAQSAIEWQRQGYDSAEVTDLVTSSMYLSKLGMMDAAAATSSLTSALKGFKLQASESMDVVDKLTAIDLKAATSAGEIATGLAQFANVGSLAGVTLDEAAAYVATIADVTQMGGSSAGQALKTIISRYGNVKAGAYNQLTFDADTSDGTQVNDVERVLNKLGISIRSSNLEFKSFSDVLGEIAERWDTLDTVSKKAIANAFAGVRQQEAFTTLLQNWDKYKELLEVSQTSKGTAARKYAAYQESLEYTQKQAKAAWEAVANSSEITEIMKSLNNISLVVAKILQFATPLAPALLAYLIARRQDNGTGGIYKWLTKGVTGADKNPLLLQNKERPGWFRWNFGKLGGKQFDAKKYAPITDQQAKTLAAAGSYGLMQGVAAISAGTTGGASHQYHDADGNLIQVSSSKRAKTVGGGVASVLAAALPLVGSLAGSVVGQKVAAVIDAQRDAANLQTETAQKQQAALNGLSGSIQTISQMRNAATIAEQEKRDKAITEFLTDIYTDENADLRKLLEEKLKGITGGVSSLYTLTKQVSSGDRLEREQATQALIIAQKEAAAEIAEAARAAARYQAQEDLKAANLQYNKDTHQADDIWLTGVGTGLAGGGIATVGTAASLIGMFGASGPVGWIIGAIVGVVAAIFAGLGGASWAEGWVSEEARGLDDQWTSMSLEEKITLLTEREDQLRQAIEDGNAAAADELEATTALKEALEDERARRFTEADAQNAETMAAAMVRAGVTFDNNNASSTSDIRQTKMFLSNLTVDQAKALGEERLYEILAAALGEDALRGMQTKFNGRYSSDFVDLARQTMSADNPALGAIFSGEAWTLNEILDELGNNTDQFSREKLRNFATAIHTSVEGLEQYRGTLGTLTYTDLTAKTGDLEKKFNDLGGVLTTVADSTQSVSEWMTTITTKYPDLIQYMSDTPTLMEKLIDKMSDLNNQVMRQQFQEYMDSGEFWESTIRAGIYQRLEGNPDARAWLDARSFGDTQQLVNELQALPTMKEGATKDAMMAVYNALRESVAGTDIILRGDEFTGLTQQFTAWIAETMRTEISALEAQRDALEKVNKQRQYEVDLLNAQNKLQDALNEKKRIYRVGAGFVYEADQKAIKEAKEGLAEVRREKDISAITKQIETLNAEATRWETYWDTRTKENQATLFTKIWGPENMDSFRAALFGGAQLDMQSILVGKGQTGGSLASALWGSKGTAKSWWESTFATSTKSFKEFFEEDFINILVDKLGVDDDNEGNESRDYGNKGGPISQYTDSGSEVIKPGLAHPQPIMGAAKVDESNEDVKAVQEAYFAVTDLMQRRRENAASVSTEEWDQALSSFGSAYERARRNYSINDEWGWVYADEAKNIFSNLPTLREAPKRSLDEAKAEVQDIIEKYSIWYDPQQWMALQADAFKTIVADSELTERDVYDLLPVSLRVHYTAMPPLASEWNNPITLGRYPGIQQLWSEYLRTAGMNGNWNGFIESEYGDRAAQLMGYQSMTAAQALAKKRGAMPPEPLEGANSGSVPEVPTSPIFGFGFASGAFDVTPSLVNELGTEAIVTPAGTLTALPSHSGVVPADITKNLWALGEVAPSLLRLMGGPAGAPRLLANALGATDESININNLQMDVNADDSFDPDAFFNEIKQRVAVTRHTR